MGTAITVHYHGYHFGALLLPVCTVITSRFALGQYWSEAERNSEAKNPPTTLVVLPPESGVVESGDDIL